MKLTRLDCPGCGTSVEIDSRGRIERHIEEKSADGAVVVEVNYRDVEVHFEIFRRCSWSRAQVIEIKEVVL